MHAGHVEAFLNGHGDAMEGAPEGAPHPRPVCLPGALPGGLFDHLDHRVQVRIEPADPTEVVLQQFLRPDVPLANHLP